MQKNTQVDQIKRQFEAPPLTSLLAKIGLAWLFFCIFLTMISFPLMKGHDEIAWLLLLAMFGPTLPLMYFAVRAEKKHYSGLAAKLIHIEDVRATFLLIELLNMPTMETQKWEIKCALVQKLPTIERADGFRFSNRHKMILYGLLTFGEPPLMLAVIGVIERMRWTAALPYIEPLAQGQGIAQQLPDIREAAASCKFILQSHLERADAPNILLRASAPATHDVLLRPSTGAGQAPHEETLQLLHPVLRPDEVIKPRVREPDQPTASDRSKGMQAPIAADQLSTLPGIESVRQHNANTIQT